MTGIKEKTGALLLFFLGICWGNIWTAQLLFCPEWWFAGVITLLTATGFAAGKIIPEGQKRIAAALLVLPVLLHSDSAWYPLLAAPVFGLWYAGEKELWCSWKTSRVFCGGLLLGGISAGYIFPAGMVELLTAGATLFYGFRSESRQQQLEMILLAVIYGCFFPLPEKEKNPAPLDPGTVISAFALLPEPASKELPKVVFVGSSAKENYRSGTELSPVSELYFQPGMPGTLPMMSDLVIITHLPRSGYKEAAALQKFLRPGGILVMPSEYWKLLPGQQWHILPGSDRKYAATAFGRNLQLVPEEMDKQLARHFRRAGETAPVAGALAGMLIDFRPEQVHFTAEKKFALQIAMPTAAVAAILIIVMGIRQSRRQKRECFRVILNCVGFIMLAALTLPRIFAGLPAITEIRAIVTACAFLWVFRRPFKRNKHDHYIWFAGLLSLIALAASWNGNWIFSLAALFFGGYAFAALDDELLSPRDYPVETLRFIALAMGALAVWYGQVWGLSATGLFIITIFLRFWSWFRS